MASYSYLPEEMIMEVSSWLPPESLFKFKLVSESWFDFITYLIEDPAFVVKHLKNSRNNRFETTSLLITSSTGKYLITARNDADERNEFPYEMAEVGLPSPQDGRNMSDEEFYQIMGGYLSEAEICHSDGIICLFVNDNIMLWNPGLLGESKLLPSYIDHPDRNTDYVITANGFGFDPIANDYKVVKIYIDYFTDLKDYKVEIYTLKGKTWKVLRGLEGHGYVGHETAVCYRGVCYWFVYAERKKILKFDLHAETFNVIPLPGPKVGSRTLKIVPWKDTIGLISFCVTKGGNGSMEMWVMNSCSGGQDGSTVWTKYLSNVRLEGIQGSLRIWMKDEVLLQDNNGRCFSYNLRTKKLRQLTVGVVEGVVYWEAYVNSLLSVNSRTNLTLQ